MLDRLKAPESLGTATRRSAPVRDPDSVAATSGKSIGVLPLVNVGGNPADEYFSDGMTDELTGTLSKVRGLRVASRTSAFTFKGRKDIDMQQIGEKLKVGTMLEGSVRRAGSRLRITAQLINVGDGLTLWSETYEHDLQDLFKVQADIARSIADALQLTLTGHDSREFAAAGTRDLKAHDLYLRGRFFLDRATEKDIRRGMELFQAALEETPSYAAAHGEIARAWMNLADDFIAPKEAWPRVRTAAGRALELDSTLADAHTFLGAVLQWYEKDLPGAERELRRAVKLNPSDANARFNLGRLLVLSGGRRKAWRSTGRRSSSTRSRPCGGMHSRRRWYGPTRRTRPWRSARRPWRSTPTSALPMRCSAPSTGQGGARPGGRGLPTRRAARVDQGELRASTWCMPAPGSPIQRDVSRGDGRRKPGRRWVAPDLIAGIYATLGERDRAFGLLEQAYEERAGYLLMLQVRPDLVPLEGIRGSRRSRGSSVSDAPRRPIRYRHRCSGSPIRAEQPLIARLRPERPQRSHGHEDPVRGPRPCHPHRACAR